MARSHRLVFSVSRTLLATGLAASTALAGACEEQDVTSNPLPDTHDGADARDGGDDDLEVSVNPYPDTLIDTAAPPDATETTEPPDVEEDELQVSVNPCYDEDGDGSFGGGFCPQEDCDDFDPTVHPGAEETCDGRDNDCDGQVDEGFELDPSGLCTSVCTVPGGQCNLDGSGAPCCGESFCQDLGTALPAGEGVCCLADGSSHANTPLGGDACCNKDLDGDGLCGP